MKPVQLATPEERAHLDNERAFFALFRLALAMTARGPLYQGTVPLRVIAERRRRNRVARKSRRTNRLTRKGQHL